MHRITITIPIWDNAHVRYESGIMKRIESDLVNLFGGYSQVDVRGVWTDDTGHWFADDSRRYEILTINGESDYGRLKAIASALCLILDQKCILTTCKNIQADFIE